MSIPLLIKLEHGRRDGETLLDLIEQPPFLPPPPVVGTEADQKVVGSKLSDRVFERQQGVIRADLTLGVGAHLLEVTHDDTKALVGLLSRIVRRGDEPIEAPWQ